MEFMMKTEVKVMKTDRERDNLRPLLLLSTNPNLKNLKMERKKMKHPRNLNRYLRSLNPRRTMTLKSVKKLYGMKMKMLQLNRKSLTKIKWLEPDNPASHYFSDGVPTPLDFWTTGMFSTLMENVNK
jgi:uncharacterized Zn-finger protein